MKDTLNHIIASADSIVTPVNDVLIQQEPSYWHLTFNELLTLIVAIFGLIVAITGLVVAICQFKKQMDKNREEQKQSNETNWYLTIIVQPQIEAINEFYKQLIDDLLLDIQISPDTITYKDLAEKQATRKEQINAFFDHLQALVKSFDIDISMKIGDIVMDLEDKVVKLLMKHKFEMGESLNPSTIRRYLLMNKKDIITALYLRMK